MRAVAVNAIGIGEHHRSPRKNLDEVSILVGEAAQRFFAIHTGDENPD
jgi:hypothetical protein